ncbi:MAG: HAMP domain-containing sensor histidine kinase [Pseudomonadota bacterium]
MADKLQALSLLAGKDAAGRNFFEVASRALALGLGSRWAGFGKLAASKNDIDILAFCDSGAAGPCFSYSLDDSPCGEVYKQEPEDPFCEFPDDVTSLFSGPEVLKQIGAFSYRGEAIFDSNGVPLAHVFTIHDGPEDWTDEDVAFFRMVAQRAGSEYNRLQAETALITAKERAEASDRAKTEFLTNTSHELRTPLNSIIGLSELLTQAGPGQFSDDKVKMFLQQIRASGGNLLEMIDDLLDISRIELGYVELNETEVSSTDCIDTATQAVQGMALKKDVSVGMTADAVALTLFADRGGLIRVLTNLIGNAVKFSHAGGAVHVHSAISDAGEALIEVRDEGIGISDADLATVFSIFGQVESGLEREYSGTGIGLPLSKELVEVHGGRLNIKSTVGSGTTVTVLLPAFRVVTGSSRTVAA